jgi:hypothetical protein
MDTLELTLLITAITTLIAFVTLIFVFLSWKTQRKVFGKEWAKGRLIMLKSNLEEIADNPEKYTCRFLIKETPYKLFSKTMLFKEIVNISRVLVNMGVAVPATIINTIAEEDFFESKTKLEKAIAQLETLLIDILAENISGKQLKYDEKANLRLTKAKISRGAFNRTLKQSKENVIKSVYTVLLLGYLGVFETTTLDPYLEIANKLHDYVEAHNEIPDKEEELKNRLKVIEIIREELETSLKRLSTPSRDAV